ncbi:unnamed protein product [Mytilus edulis]|uniref:Uncharacterized protein n=1 Tax=Mytilus edulis TaxID=6550 RepID=A0A8S3SNT9_MYTED|nr:unnamed protein product [Mytilus edulis]
MIDFYLDIGCSFLLTVFENVSCCGNDKVSNSQSPKDTRRKRRVLLTRITFGLIFNIAAFITVCVVNEEIFIEGKTALGLFITIVVFTMITYIVIKVSVWIAHVDRDDSLLDHMIFYRLYEIEFDILVFIYSLYLSYWKITEFTTTTTVLGCVDILVNIIILGRNVYDSKEKTDALLYICFGIFLAPLVPFVFLIIMLKREAARLQVSADQNSCTQTDKEVV